MSFIPKRKTQVTRSTLKLEKDTPVYMYIQGRMYRGRKVAKAKIQNEPTLMPVIDLESGALCTVVVPTVLQGELDRAYPNGGYAGRSFEVTKRPVSGKNYALFDLFEIETPDGIDLGLIETHDECEATPETAHEDEAEVPESAADDQAGTKPKPKSRR